MMEIGARILGLPYYYSSDGVAFLNAFPPAQRMRRQKTAKEMEKDPSGESTHDNLLDTYYPNRPESMENVSLIAFFMFYEYVCFLRLRAKSKKLKKLSYIIKIQLFKSCG